jgi:hypothetical protein
MTSIRMCTTRSCICKSYLPSLSTNCSVFSYFFLCFSFLCFSFLCFSFFCFFFFFFFSSSSSFFSFWFSFC